MYVDNNVYDVISSQLDTLLKESDIIWRNNRNHPHGFKKKNRDGEELKGKQVYVDNILKDLKESENFRFFASSVTRNPKYTSPNLSDDDIFEVFEKYRKMSRLSRYFMKRRYIKQTFGRMSMHQAKKRVYHDFSGNDNAGVFKNLLDDIDAVKKKSDFAVASNMMVVSELRNDISALLALGYNKRNNDIVDSLCRILAELYGVKGKKDQFSKRESNALLKKFMSVPLDKDRAKFAYANIPQKYIDKIKEWQNDVALKAGNSVIGDISSDVGTCKLLAFSNKVFSSCKNIVINERAYDPRITYQMINSIKGTLKELFGSQNLSEHNREEYCKEMYNILKHRHVENPFINSKTPQARIETVSKAFKFAKEDFIEKSLPVTKNRDFIYIMTEEEIKNLSLQDVNNIVKHREEVWKRSPYKWKKVPVIFTPEEYESRCQKCLGYDLRIEDKASTESFMASMLADAKSIFNQHVKKLILQDMAKRNCVREDEYDKQMYRVFKGRHFQNENALYAFNPETDMPEILENSPKMQEKSNQAQADVSALPVAENSVVAEIPADPANSNDDSMHSESLALLSKDDAPANGGIDKSKIEDPELLALLPLLNEDGADNDAPQEVAAQQVDQMLEKLENEPTVEAADPLAIVKDLQELNRNLERMELESKQQYERARQAVENDKVTQQDLINNLVSDAPKSVTSRKKSKHGSSKADSSKASSQQRTKSAF